MTGVEKEKLAEIVLGQGHIRLQAQLQVALAADQRAVNISMVFTTSAIAVVGFGAVAFTGSTLGRPFGFGALVAGVCLAISGLIALSAAWPVRFRFPGNLPDNWWSDDVENRPLFDTLRKESENYNDYILTNRAIIQRSVGRLHFAGRLGVLAPILGLIAWWAAQAAA